MRRRCTSRKPGQRDVGFTMIEMIIGLVLMSILAVVMVPLLQMPMVGYIETQRRVELQSQLDLVREKLAFDLSSALPGSVRWRQVGTVQYLEYLEVRATGRYLASGGTPPSAYCAANNDALVVGGDTCFTSLGALSPSRAYPGTINPVVNDYVVVPPSGGANINPYVTAGTSPTVRLTAWAATATGHGIRWGANHVFPLDNQLKRFYLVVRPVSYVCDPVNRWIRKYSGYPLAAAQPVAFGGATISMLSNQVSTCLIGVTTSLQAPDNLRQVVSARMALSIMVNGQAAETAQQAMQFAVREP